MFCRTKSDVYPTCDAQYVVCGRRLHQQRSHRHTKSDERQIVAAAVLLVALPLMIPDYNVIAFAHKPPSFGCCAMRLCVCVCVCVTRCVCVNAERFAGMAFPDRNSPIKRQTLVVWITVDSLNLGISLRTVEEKKRTETKLTSIQHKINRNCWCLSCGREKLFCVRLAEEISFFNCAVFCDFYRKFHFKYLYFYSDRQF